MYREFLDHCRTEGGRVVSLQEMVGGSPVRTTKQDRNGTGVEAVVGTKKVVKRFGQAEYEEAIKTYPIEEKFCICLANSKVEVR